MKVFSTIQVYRIQVTLCLVHFAHEIGPINYVNVIKSTYEGGTFNGIYIPPYDYRLESQGGLKRDDRYDDMAYRFCVAGGRDYTWYIQNELCWPLKQETVDKIKAFGYKETIPVQSVYLNGIFMKLQTFYQQVHHMEAQHQLE